MALLTPVAVALVVVVGPWSSQATTRIRGAPAQDTRATDQARRTALQPSPFAPHTAIELAFGHGGTSLEERGASKLGRRAEEAVPAAPAPANSRQRPRQALLREAAALPKDAAAPPVSKVLACIASLSCQYFAIYFLLAMVKIWRNVAEGSGDNIVAKTLEATQATVNFVPMLCVLFLATRMRALQLTGGQPEKYQLPQWWVELAMRLCSWTILGQLIVVLVFPCIWREAPSADNDGNVDPPKANRAVTLGFLLVRYALMLLLYGSFAAVCIGVCVMKAPKEVYPGSSSPPVSPAVVCVICLTVQYFAVYCALALCRTYNQARGYSRTRTSDAVQMAAFTVNFSPMLCILFVAARIRALQMDPRTGNPQLWAQACFYLCTGSVLAQTFLVIVVSLLCRGVAGKGWCEGDIALHVRQRGLSMVLLGLRAVVLVCLYGGYTAIIVSIMLLQHKDGWDATPPLSPTMLCVVALSVQFFAVYLALCCIGLHQGIFQSNAGESEAEHSGGTLFILRETLDAARHAVVICPMLCVLFLALRMRALQLTGNRGAPQGWAQDLMFVATWAVWVQLVLVLMTPCITGRAPNRDASARRGSSRLGRILAYVVEVKRALFLFVLYGCACCVLVAIFQMTPANANGRGAMHLYGHADRAAF